MTIFHMKQSIAGCLRNNPVGTIDFLEDENGKPLSDAEARIELNKLLAMGHTVMPVDTDCEGFDVFGGGCPGHEQLTGSDLTRAMLARGDKYIKVAVSQFGDESALNQVNGSNVKVVIGYTVHGFAERESFYRYAIPINNQGEPLTAKEAGL